MVLATRDDRRTQNSETRSRLISRSIPFCDQSVMAVQSVFERHCMACHELYVSQILNTHHNQHLAQ